MGVAFLLRLRSVSCCWLTLLLFCFFLSWEWELNVGVFSLSLELLNHPAFSSLAMGNDVIWFLNVLSCGFRLLLLMVRCSVYGN